MRRLLIHVGIFLFTVAFVIIGVFAYDLEPIPNPFYAPVQAAPVDVEPQATATPEPVQPCELWRMAGDQKIYKCVDDEAPWATCYQPAGGVLQCLKE